MSARRTGCHLKFQPLQGMLAKTVAGQQWNKTVQLTLVLDNITLYKHMHTAKGENTLQVHMSHLDESYALGVWENIYIGVQIFCVAGRYRLRMSGYLQTDNKKTYIIDNRDIIDIKSFLFRLDSVHDKWLLFAFWGLNTACLGMLFLLDRQSDDSVSQCYTPWVVYIRWSDTLTSTLTYVNATRRFCKSYGSSRRTVDGWPFLETTIFFIFREAFLWPWSSFSFWHSMCEWAGGSWHCTDKEQWYLAPGLKSGILDETYSILWGEMNCKGAYKPLLQYLSRQEIGVLPLAAPDNHRTGCSWTEWEASLISMDLTYSCRPFRYKANGWGLICNHEVGL